MYICVYFCGVQILKRRNVEGLVEAEEPEIIEDETSQTIADAAADVFSHDQETVFVAVQCIRYD